MYVAVHRDRCLSGNPAFGIQCVGFLPETEYSFIFLVHIREYVCGFGELSRESNQQSGGKRIQSSGMPDFSGIE